MIDIKHVIENPQLYRDELIRRGGMPEVVDNLLSAHMMWKQAQQKYEQLRAEQNQASATISQASIEDRAQQIRSVKGLSEQVKAAEAEAKRLKVEVDAIIVTIPSLTWHGIPIGRSDEDNQEIKQLGSKPQYSFNTKPYWELPVYTRCVSSEAGAKAMGARGFYLKGDIALLQKALFDYVLDIVLGYGLELMYVPLMLNDTVLKGTGHLPDFDGQQYEVPIDEHTAYYLIGSSEPSIMGYYMDEHLGELPTPILNTCWSTCFRKEAGSYGRDQQGILRVHQFEKIEMVAIGSPEDCLKYFDIFGAIEEEIYTSLGLHVRVVEVCSGDLPYKHFRQVDYEAWFPSQMKYRELGSNGNASDYQNRGLRITYIDKNGQKAIPWGLNCTAVTFRTGLAILEQFQREDGSVVLPDVLAKRMKKEVLT